MAKATNLSGHCDGNYYQHNSAHPLSLELIQEGERLTGSMRDGKTDKEIRLFCTSCGQDFALEEQESL